MEISRGTVNYSVFNSQTIFRMNRLFLLIVFSIVTVLCFTPLLSKYSTEAVALLFVFSLIAILVNFKTLNNINFFRCLICSIFYIGLLTLYKIVGISSCEWSWLASYYCWIMLSIASFSSLKLFNKYSLRFILVFISLLVLINQIIIISNSSSLANTKDGVYAASTQYGTALTLFSGLTLVWILNERKALLTILGLANIICSAFINILIMQRATNMLLLFLLLIMILMFEFKKKNNNKAFYAFLFLIVLFAFLWISGYLEQILTFVSNSIGSERLSSRLEELIIFIRTGNVADTNGFSGRYDLMRNSINTWKSSIGSFVFGVGDHRVNDLIVGNHSDVIDSLARYGLVGFLILTFTILFHGIFIKSELKKTCNPKFDAQFFCVFIIFVVRNIIGNSLITFVSIPMYIFGMSLVYYVQRKDQMVNI